MADKEQVIQAVRATLISVKGAITMRQCNRDYLHLEGERIPYEKLGYSSLEKFFVDVPGFTVTHRNGDCYVDAIATADSQHIVSMVSKQRPAKKSAPKFSFQNRFPRRIESWRKPQSSYGSRTSYSNQYYSQTYRPNTTSSFNNNKHNKVKEKVSREIKPIKVTKSSEQTPARTAPPIAVPKKTGKTSSVSARVQACAEAAQKNKEVPSVSKKKISTETNNKEINRRETASQRLSNFRDRLTVDMIPLPLPVNSSEKEPQENNVVDVTPPLQTLPDTASAQEKLVWSCKRFNLPLPVYKVHDHRPKRGAISYDCTVKIGDVYSASSYPDSSPSEELARQVAALKLLSVVENSEAASLSTASVTSAIPRLAELVAEHNAGILSNTVPLLYKEKYGENLPPNWSKLIEACPKIVKDNIANGIEILLPCNEVSQRVTCISENTLEEAFDAELPPLQFPEDNFWNVYVTVSNSTLEVWLRIIGPEYSEVYETLLQEMDEYYAVSGINVHLNEINENSWYAVCLEEGGWQRAKVLEIQEDNITVFLGDHGDDEIIHSSQIRLLEPQFRTLPAQAILCRLDGIEELAPSGLGAEVVRRRLVGQVLVAEPAPQVDPNEHTISVTLYDTSTKRDINLNKEIIHDFSLAGDLTITQRPIEVEVGCVTDDGHVWVSRVGGAALVRAALDLLTAPGPYRRQLPSVPQTPTATTGARYIVKTLNNEWVRCTIISGLDSEGTVRTQLVDSGQTLRAPLSSLVPLSNFSPAMNAFPPQAKEVRLGSAERVAGSMVERLRSLLLGTRVICRALPITTGPQLSFEPPHVELFVRTAPENLLASVNNAILVEYDLQQVQTKEDDEEANNPLQILHRKKERIFSRNTSTTSVTGNVTSEICTLAKSYTNRTLPSPNLPAPGQCIDVFVAMAANPWNFIVQLNHSRRSLLSMMAELQKECPKIPESESPTNPASGELYTMLYDKDNSWYRVTVAGAMSTEVVSVYFCDFGDLAIVSASSLRPVPNVKLARTLPPQAIKARLYDVLPLNRDWSVEDCMRFSELCVEQQFVGICKDVGNDPLNTGEPLLTLNLIDTTTDDDIYVNKQLVTEGRARLASSQ